MKGKCVEGVEIQVEIQKNHPSSKRATPKAILDDLSLRDSSDQTTKGTPIATLTKWTFLNLFSN